MSRQPRLPWLMAVARTVAACVLVGATAGAGIASVHSVNTQQELAAHAWDVSRTLAEAGRVEALVGQIADPRTNPTTLAALRLQLARSALLIQIQAGDWTNHQPLPAAVGGPSDVTGPAPDTLRGAEASDVNSSGDASPASTQLGLLAAQFADAAYRATAQDASLAPGKQLRGDLDAAYPVLRDTATLVLAALDAAASGERARWVKVVSWLLAAATSTTGTLVWLTSQRARPAALAEAQPGANLQTSRRQSERVRTRDVSARSHA
ncbi:hypothetical protein [Kineosporia sp. R_H_3]|uniref:hypothetical protein n=1 Tax=Kineosporia sp. R_H_3 TaxID=1961848 RepID=UPI00130437DB|nr:hypothetical protein [Kineosporia sp. R_H_3]MBI4942484.1 hypothetical protein [Actinomycetota bacterium]